MAVYDDQDTKTKADKIENDELRNITGIGVGEEDQMESSARDGANEDIAERQKLTDDSDNKQSKKESSSGSDDTKPHNPGNKVKHGKFGGFISKKSNQIIVGGIITLVTAIMTAFFVTLPTMVVNHVSEMIKGIGNVQINYQKKYRRKYIYKVGDMFTPSGKRSGKIISELDLKGLKPVYEPDGRTLRGFQKAGGEVLPAVDVISEHMESRHPLRSSRWKTKRMNDFYKRYKISRKSVVLAAEIDLDKSIDRVINGEIADEALADESGKISVGDEDIPDNETSEEASAREARKAEARSIIETDGSLDELKKDLKEGIPAKDLDAEKRAVLRVGLEFDDELVGMLNDSLFNSPTIGKRLLGGLKSAAGSAILEAPDKICSVKTKLDGAILASRIYRAATLMRIAAIFIKNGDQTRIGDVAPAAMGEVMRRVMTADKKGRGFGASEGGKSLITKKFSKSRNNLKKSTYGVDGSPVGIEKGMHDFSKGMKGCSIIQNPFAQIGAAVGEAALSFFTAGGGKAAFVGTKEATEEGVKQIIKGIVKDTIKSMATKKGAALLVGNVALELSFEGMMTYLQIRAEKALSLNATGQEVGGDLSDFVAAGGGTMNKQRSLEAGLVPATTTQYAQALQEYKLDKQEEIKGQSFYARVFDYNNQDSLMFKSASLAFASPIMSTNVGSITTNLAQSIFRLPNTLLQNSASLLTHGASAADGDEVEFDSFEAGGKSIATDFAGNVQTVMLKEVEDIDPEQNIKDLIASDDIESSEPYKPKSEAFKNHVKNCVESEDSLSVLEQYSDTEDPQYDCLANTSKAKKFKAHLAYMNMVDGVDSYLFPDEIEGSSSGPESSGTAIIPGEGLPWPLAQTKAEADSTQGSCIQKDSRSVCKAGHPYIAYDLFAPQGTQIRAVSKGEVISAKVGSCGHDKNRAFTVSVFDSEKNTTYFYQHMDPDAGGVKKGDIIKPGDPIGKVGPSSAACDTNPHLHIDASAGKGRSACSRQGCSDTTKAKFIDIGPALFKGYEVLQ